MTALLQATAPGVEVGPGNATLTLASSLGGRVLADIPGAVLLGTAPVGPVVQVPWTQSTCEYLGAIRAPCVPRMLIDYDWRVMRSDFVIAPHQFRMAGMMSMWRRGFCLGQPATGKTLSALWAADYLIKAGLVRKALVVTLKTIMRPAWSGDASAHLPWLKHTIVYTTDAKNRRKRAYSPDPLHITNFESAEVCHDELLANGYDLVIIDESTAVKTHTTRRWRFLHPICHQAKYVWCMTGTPTAQAPTDAYGQVLMLYGDAWGVSASRFKEMTMVRVQKHTWVPVANAADVVFSAMQPAISVKKRDVFPDMPEKTESMLDVDLTKEQVTAIKELKKAATTQLASGGEITAVHAAALRTKIIQIASGVVKDAGGVAHHVDNAHRMGELLRIVTEARSLDTDPTIAPWNKIIVLCAFVNTCLRVAEELTAKGFKVACLHSGVSLTQREQVLDKRAFNQTREVEIIVAIPEILSHGLTLTAANITVWFTPADKADVAEQANNRMDRLGQKNPMQIIRLSGCEAERTIYQRLSGRLADHATFMSMYSQIVSAL